MIVVHDKNAHPSIVYNPKTNGCRPFKTQLTFHCRLPAYTTKTRWRKDDNIPMEGWSLPSIVPKKWWRELNCSTMWGGKSSSEREMASSPSSSGIKGANCSSEGEYRTRKDYWCCWKAPDMRWLATDHRSTIKAQESGLCWAASVWVCCFAPLSKDNLFIFAANSFSSGKGVGYDVQVTLTRPFKHTNGKAK